MTCFDTVIAPLLHFILLCREVTQMTWKAFNFFCRGVVQLAYREGLPKVGPVVQIWSSIRFNLASQIFIMYIKLSCYGDGGAHGCRGPSRDQREWKFWGSDYPRRSVSKIYSRDTLLRIRVMQAAKTMMNGCDLDILRQYRILLEPANCKKRRWKWCERKQKRMKRVGIMLG